MLPNCTLVDCSIRVTAVLEYIGSVVSPSRSVVAEANRLLEGVVIIVEPELWSLYLSDRLLRASLA